MLSAIMWPFSKKKFPPITHIPNGQWSVAVAEREGQRVVLRINSWAWDLRGHPDYAWRLGIAAPIAPGTDPASLNSAESPYCQFEDRAGDVLQSQCESINVAVLTGETFRELVFHTRDVEAAKAKLDALCDEFSDIQAAYISEHDPKWSSFTELCGGRRP